ncbi:MAG: ribonuclease HII [Elusimicrobia bacterium]|nr:ribonuclease HII [Elusimicrobiota bacterium]
MLAKRLYRFDQEWRDKGFPFIAGVDEAGRGPWAGPVVAAAVILKPENAWKGLNDSKQVLPETRERLFELITRESLFHSVSVVDHHVVDETNILQATFLAMKRALHQLQVRPDLVLVDGNRKIPDSPVRQEAIVKGDAKSASVAAASILAKVTRDRLMASAHQKYPHYDFANNKGYGTPTHRDALKRFGPCEIHRRSYAPVIEAVSPLLPFGEF